MEFLRENRNIVIIITLLVIGYFLFKSEFIRNLYMNLRIQWSTMTGSSKLVAGVVIILLAYYLWNREY